MMQIGGVDNLVLKDVKLPSESEQNEKKIEREEEASKAREDDAAKKAQEQKDVRACKQNRRTVRSGDKAGRGAYGISDRAGGQDPGDRDGWDNIC